MTTEADSADTPPLDVQIVRAIRACKLNERKWLRKLQEHDFSPWRTAAALRISKSVVWSFLRRPRVRKAMDLMDQRDAAQLGITRQFVLLRYLQLADSDLKRFYHEDGTLLKPSDWKDDHAQAVAEYGFDAQGLPKLKLHDKKGALDALAKILKLFGAERLEVTGKDGLPLPAPVVVVSREEAARLDRELDDEV